MIDLAATTEQQSTRPFAFPDRAGAETRAHLGNVQAPGSQTPPNLTPQQQAETLRHNAAAIFLKSAFSNVLDGHIELEGFKLYLDQFVRDAGDPADPIEAAMVTQINLINLMLLHVMTRCMTATGDSGPRHLPHSRG